MVAKEQQSQPLASQSPPAWASHTEHMMADSSEGGKQSQHHGHHETDALIADYYGSYSNSPQSQQSSNSLLTLSPRSSTSQASNPASLDFTKNMKYNDEHHDSAAANMNIAALASLDSGSKKASRVRKATPSKCVSSIAGAAAAGNNGGSNSMRSPSNLKCQLCLFATQNRLEFSQHLSTHCRNLDDIEPQEFTKLVMEQLSGNLGPADDLASPPKKTNYNNNNNNNIVSNNNNNNSLDIPVYDQSGDELGLRVPRVQTNGKVKLFRCKQCPYVAIVKVDFWDHSRQHIKPEKLLTCPKCPFVTEYKHHLEYHLRNHFGSKPFKCEQCDYSCVNKSMLNSHLKSHSDVYQFRCNECNYATKYCHSLKLHLRKYSHTPSVVLNTDGTPNPLPIVDVYGTRRGPKTKSEDTTPPPQDIVSALLPVVVSKLQPARQQKQQQQQLQTPPSQQESAGAAALPSPPQPQYNFSNSIPIRFDSPIGGGSAPPQLPMTPAASPKSLSMMPYIDQEDAVTTIHLLASLGGGPASFNPYIAAAAMQAANSRVAELGGPAGLRAELDQLTKITNPVFLGSADMCSRVLALTLNILREGVKHAESRSSGNGYNKKVIVNSLDSNSSSTDTASSQEGAPLDLSKANHSKIRRDDEAPQDLTKSNNNVRSNSCDDDYEEEEEEDQEDDADEEYDADEQPASPELRAIVAKLCRHKPVMRSVHGSLAFLRQYLMFLRATQLQSLGFM
ncbi:protein hunchback-like [Trichogramma pretiosum]|uniref:protein hunchback-like n=1 Tax=Trichogramma pretiosum TaxID=7493 RepID=UPI0006C9CA90|nr:protein hunchback-like [Trichogramma pretiosum]XP_023314313.1 protein hunchback-like [Trichogramma pretiosum]